MKYTTFGSTDVKISKISLGTMTFGEQNSKKESIEQLDYAFEQGINFIDTAELYPIPPTSKTYGDTETIIGQWDKLKQKRESIFLASKIAGPSSFTKYMRDGKLCYNKENIENALNNSLKRLKTDYIDLFQLHWPERQTNFFGQLGFNVSQNISQEENITLFSKRLEALQYFQKIGKIKYFGISNETPWGILKYNQESIKKNYPKIQSLQNPYNLLNRTFEIGLAEICHREKISMLAYSPLAFGTLSGKYLNNQFPKGSRITLYKHYNRYLNNQSVKATEKYIEIARLNNLDPSQMSLAYLLQKPYLASIIIGATNREQLKININSIDLQLPSSVIEQIDKVHATNPNPAP